MSKRAKNGKPLGLQLDKNIDTDLYETEENGITYCIPFGLMDALKREYKHLGSVEAWYSNLKIGEKKSIIRQGLPDNTEYYNDGFHVD